MPCSNQLQQPFHFRYVASFLVPLACGMFACKGNVSSGGCQPTSCEALSKQCGQWPDGCNHTLTCGPCDPVSQYCDTEGRCQSCTDHCSDQIQNCQESGLDCGGECGVCPENCANHCSNQAQDCGESGVDCGGECEPCPDACLGHCTNQTQDCGETGVDCGGECNLCPDACSNHCTDKRRNCAEIGVDCGGECPACCSSNCGSVFYLAPDLNLDQTPNSLGNDTNDGLSEAKPWKTFAHAWQVMQPGDTLVLIDGIYHQTLAPNQRDGEPGKPITILAQNDGRAIIDGQNQRATVSLKDQANGWNIGNYYVIEGIVARNSSGTVWVINGSNNILRRVSGYNGNTDTNDHVFTIAQPGQDNLLEDCVASGTGRKMIFTWGGNRNTIRRCLARWQHYDSRAACGEWPWNENLEFYNSSNSVMEDSISLGAGAFQAVSVLGNINSANGNSPYSHHNQLLGIVSVREAMFADGSLAEWPTNRPGTDDGTSCGDIVAPYKAWSGWRRGFGVTLWGGDTPETSAQVHDVLFQDIFAWGNAGNGFNVTNNFPSNNVAENNLLDHATIVGNGLDLSDLDGGQGANISSESNLALGGLTVTHSNIGGTPYQGEGARLQYRHIDGILTNSPLWPWPMEDRILDELAIDVTGDITEILRQNGVPTGSTIAAPSFVPLPPHPTTDLHPGMVAVWHQSPIQVTLTHPDEGIVLRFTTDGTEPTATSPQYSGPLTVSQTSILKAKAFSGDASSHARSAIYRIDPNLLNLPPEVQAGILPFITDYAEIVQPQNQVGLYGLAEDTTFPNPPGQGGKLSTTWTMISGPEPVVFADSTKPRTTAVFPAVGLYTLRLTASDGTLTTFQEAKLQVWPADLQGITFSVPGRIESANYKPGGEGAGYHQTHSYGDVIYRNQPVSNVDLTIAYNDGWGYAIIDGNVGEWYAYSVNVEQAGTYTLKARVAGAVGGGKFHVTLDGQDISGQLTIPENGSGSYRKWDTLTATTPSLQGGNHELRIVVDAPSSAPGSDQLNAAIHYIELSK